MMYNLYPNYRAIEVWGSWQVLESQLERRHQEREDEERRRQGEMDSRASVIITCVVFIM